MCVHPCALYVTVVCALENCLCVCVCAYNCAWVCSVCSMCVGVHVCVDFCSCDFV